MMYAGLAIMTHGATMIGANVDVRVQTQVAEWGGSGGSGGPTGSGNPGGATHAGSGSGDSYGNGGGNNGYYNYSYNPTYGTSAGEEKAWYDLTTNQGEFIKVAWEPNAEQLGAIKDAFGILNDYIGKFRDMNQVARLYNDAVKASYNYRCGCFVPSYVVLRETERCQVLTLDMRENGTVLFLGRINGTVLLKDENFEMKMTNCNQNGYATFSRGRFSMLMLTRSDKLSIFVASRISIPIICLFSSRSIVIPSSISKERVSGLKIGKWDGSIFLT